jgi:hypothetical protein
MKTLIKKTKNEEGSVLVIVSIILVLLTIIGISATKTTEIEQLISGNHLFHKVSFHHADSGVYITPKLITECLDNGAEQSANGITYLGNTGTFYNEIMGFSAWDSSRDIRFTLGGFNVDMDVNRTGTQRLAGGGAEFASGFEGTGVGASGGVAVFYAIDSEGNGPASSVSNTRAIYRKVVGVAGGL